MDHLLLSYGHYNAVAFSFKFHTIQIRDSAQISEVFAIYEGRGKDKFYFYCRQNGLWPLEVGGYDLEERPAFLVPYCPVRNISRDYPPTLLLHGDRDSEISNFYINLNIHFD